MKTIKSLQQVIDIIKSKGITFYNYVEDGKLCGYDLDTYTSCGINKIIFLDFRDEEKDAENVNDFIEQLNYYVNNIDIDEEIELNRHDKNYRENFTFRQSLDDFEKWKTELEEIIQDLKNNETLNSKI